MEQLGRMVFKHEATATLRNSEKPSSPHEEAIKMQISLLAEVRVTQVSELQLRSYSKGLSGFAIEDVRTAVATMGMQARPEGGTALPSLGEMVKGCQQAAQRRHEAARRVREAEESAYVSEHPDQFCDVRGENQLMQMLRRERQAQVEAVEKLYGPEWRDNLVWMGRDANGSELPGSVQLGDLYERAVRG